MSLHPEFRCLVGREENTRRMCSAHNLDQCREEDLLVSLLLT